jgi:hypothetical protein
MTPEMPVASAQVAVSAGTTAPQARYKQMNWRSKLVAILLASLSGTVSAQVDCKTMRPGPERTDCYLALSEYYRAQSDLAAAKARVQADAAWYRAITGVDLPAHKPRHKLRSHH